MIQKYIKRKVPFYTLYPTQSNWEKINNNENFNSYLEKIIKSNSQLSMYLHFPFCPKQCYFCHCYTVISRKEDHYDKISSSIIKELELLFNLARRFGKKLKITDIHFGGGTPTVIPEKKFEKIIQTIKENIDSDALKEIALEVDPRNDMNSEKLLKYSFYGVNRISLGIQDFDKDVQKAVNRINDYELIDNLLNKKVRETFDSINFDFIFGLPKQTKKSLETTTKKIVSLKPSRITILNMDHRPEIYRHQNAYKEIDLPTDELKIQMYELCTNILILNNYQKIGVNHFALDNDILSKYKNEKKLYRNPNGFSPGWAYDMISVGPSATGKLGNYYYQNIYSVDKYIESIEKKIFPINREKKLNNGDIKRRKIIMDLLNFEELHLKELNDNDILDNNVLDKLEEFVEIDFLNYDEKNQVYSVTDLGSYFINHICNIFDSYKDNKYLSQREFKDGIRSLDRNLNLNKF